MDMQAIIVQLAVLFIILVLGYIVSKAKVLSPDAGGIMTKIVLSITLPCTILSSAVGGNLKISGAETAFYMLMSLLMLFISVAVAMISSRFFGGDKADHGLYASMIAFGNVGFMGFPVAHAIFGAGSDFFVSMNMIAFQVLTFGLGPILIAGKNGKISLKILRTPALIASFLTILLALINFRAPAIIVDVLKLLGNVTTPGSMLIIGFMLAQTPLSKVFSQWRLYLMTVLKLIFIPVITWLILKQLISNELMLGVLVVLSGMPTAAIVGMFAIEYKGNEPLASGGVFLTTLISGVTVPLVVYLLLM